VRRGFASALNDEPFVNFRGTANSINGDLHADLQKLRRRARQEAYDDPYVVKFLSMFRTNVTGPAGIQMQADFLDKRGDPDEQDNRTVEEAFAAWGRRGICDIGGRLSWVDAQALVISTIARDGEVLIRLVRNAPNPFGFAIQILETDYLDEKHVEDLGNGRRIVMGVELDEWDRPVNYHLRPSRAYFDPINSFTRRTEQLVIPASEILHPFPVIRPGQVRGYPLTHAVLRRLHMLDGYEEAEVVAARKGACHGGFIKTPTGEEYSGEEVDADGNVTEEMSPGEFRQLPEGWEFQQYSPEHPTSAYKDFVKGALRGTASGLNVPYNSLAGDLESVSYSSLRQAALEERDIWRFWQQWFVAAVCMPVYENFFDMALLKGALKLPVTNREKFMRVRFQPRGWQWVDPLKEIQAAREAISLGVTTRQDVLSAQGKNFEDTVAQLQKEKKALELAGLKGLDSGESKVSSDPEDED
jgi:lambda family phage portal protein